MRRNEGDIVQTDAARQEAGLWKARDVANFLNVSISWVRHAPEELIPCIQIGALRRYDPAVIKALGHNVSAAVLQFSNRKKRAKKSEA